MAINCELHSATKDTFGNESYYPCFNKPKFTVIITSAINSQRKTYTVCGVHKNSLQKTATRVNRILNKDVSQIVITELPK